MPTEENISACVVKDTDKTLTLTHNFTDNKTTMTFKNESQVFSLSVQNNTSIIKEALEDMIIGL
jgi:hypothetical protein